MYQNVREIHGKGGFNLTKWIASDEEVKSQIPEADRSRKIVKILEAEPQLSLIFGLNWNGDTDGPIVCRATEQEVPAKKNQRMVLSFVSAVFDQLGRCSPFTIRMQCLLKNIWEAMGHASDKELSAEHSKLFSDWRSELREIGTMSINRLFFENGRSNLRLHIFTEASEEAISIVANLQVEATLKLTYVIGKCRVAPIRHTTIPKLDFQAAVYGVRLRKQILREHDFRIDKTFYWTDSLTGGHFTVVTFSSLETTSVCCQQGGRNTRNLFHGSMETSQRHRKPIRYLHKRDVHRKPPGFLVVKGVGMASDR